MRRNIKSGSPWPGCPAEQFLSRPATPPSDWPESRSCDTARGSRSDSETPEDRGEQTVFFRNNRLILAVDEVATWLDQYDWYRLQEDEGLGEQVTEEVVVGQTDALEVSGGVDLLEQLRELRLEHVHLRHTAGEQLSWSSLCVSYSAECWFHFHFKDTRFFIFWEQMCSLLRQESQT